MHRRPLIPSLGVLLLGAFGIASAQNAYTSKPMNVRAGPDRTYPLVAQVGPGAPLDVHGCLSDWSWCDVSFDDNRGWVYAGSLSFVYQGERVPLYSYGPSLGLPIVTFTLGAYWDDYYRGRPWYAQRSSWAHRRLPPHMGPPGRPHAGPPPMPSGHRAVGGHPEGTEHGRATPPGRSEHAAPPQRTMQARPPERGGRAMPSGPTRQTRPAEQNAHGAQRGHAPEQKRPPPSHGSSDHGDHRPPGDGNG